MLQIAGGFYHEWCREGPNGRTWDELFGSGLRAAAAVARWDGPIFLTSYAALHEVAAANAAAGAFDVEINVIQRAHSISFRYDHPLATPMLVPQWHTLPRESPFTVEGDAVLRFGMVEGDAVVHAARAVYDPQATYNPRPFRENGSTANDVVVVANSREAKLLTGCEDLAEAGRALCAAGAEAAVIKKGVNGTTVITDDGVHNFPPNPSRNVWPIGTGDVFSAAIAAEWAMVGRPLLDAVRTASQAVAHYVENPRLLPLDPARVRQGGGSSFTPVKRTVEPTVYLAGPFFTMGQRWLVDQARDALRDFGLSVFSPLHDVGMGDADDVAPADLEGLDRSTAVLALVDGLDAGTVFEIGYARAKNIPVVAFVQNEDAESLKMITGSGCDLVSDFATAVYRTAWTVLKAP